MLLLSAFVLFVLATLSLAFCSVVFCSAIFCANFGGNFCGSFGGSLGGNFGGTFACASVVVASATFVAPWVPCVFSVCAGAFLIDVVCVSDSGQEICDWIHIIRLRLKLLSLRS